jgi:hypothetical protein
MESHIRDTRDAGSCSYCNEGSEIVTELRGLGAPAVRFCPRCLKKFRRKTASLKESREARRRL